MADDVIVYWVPYKGTIFGCSLASRTYVGISSMERLGASKRALDFAGIPHKDWPHGEPASMEEFGVNVGWVTSKVNGAVMDHVQALEWIDKNANDASAKSGEAHRMLGMILGWTEPLAGTPEVAGINRLLNPAPYQIVIAKSTGAWYAYAPGVFFHIKNMDHYHFLFTARLVPDVKYAVSAAEDNLIDFIHQECIRGGDPGKIEAPMPPPPPKTYPVVAGDTFSGIAKKLGVTEDALKAANPEVTDINKISVGQVLNVPKA